MKRGSDTPILLGNSAPMARTFNASAPDFETRFSRFLGEQRADGHDVGGIVAKILDEVEVRGGEAVARYTAQFDELQIDPTTLQSDNVDLAALAADCPADLKAAIDFAHDRIAAYHSAQRPADHSFTDEAGVELGVDRIVMVAPAPKGEMSPAVAYAALRAGVDEFYPLGGAQAVGALAFGAGRLAPVDKIVGPGNAFVAEAKRQVFGRVGIDTIAGPSEILVIADETANPDWIAADLLSQAEHDPSSQSILITVNEAVGRAVDNAVDKQLKTLATGERAARSWSTHGAIIFVADLDQAATIANRIAAEHVELAVADPDAMLPKIRHAGAVFLGHHTPEALGDYVTGSNHVLPTSRAARFSSGLGLYDFLKRMSVQRASPEGFAALAPAALRLAEAERLPAHARSISIRSNAVQDSGTGDDG